MTRSALLALAAVLLATSPDLAAAQTSPARGPVQWAPTLTIARARRLAEGRAVRVEGVVTVASGVIDAGFAIQDATGGIYVAADSALRLQAGERVRVTGRIGDNHGLTTIVPAETRRIGRAHLPGPRRVRTGRVGEGTEGRVVTVRGTAADSVSSDLPYGYKLWIDDGSGRVQVFFPATGLDFALRRIRRGSEVTVTGFSGQYDRTIEILPRSRADVVVRNR